LNGIVLEKSTFVEGVFFVGFYPVNRLSVVFGGSPVTIETHEEQYRIDQNQAQQYTEKRKHIGIVFLGRMPFPLKQPVGEKPYLLGITKAYRYPPSYIAATKG
jgi:hypothetical protein